MSATKKTVKNGTLLESSFYFLKIGGLTVNCVMWIDLGDEAGLYKLYEQGKFINKKGYVDINTNTVWIYREEEPPATSFYRYPYIWFNEESKYMERNHPDQYVIEQANFDNARDRSLNTVVQSVEDDLAVPNKKMDKIIRAGANMVLPIIKLKDDHLKKQVKAIIRKKMRSLTNLPTIGGQSHLIANMKQALLTDTKMSTPYHIGWSDVLGNDFIHLSFDNGKDTEYPLPEAVVYDSRTDMISYLSTEQMEKILDIIKNNAQSDEILLAKTTKHVDDDDEENVEVIDPEPTEEEEE